MRSAFRCKSIRQRRLVMAPRNNDCACVLVQVCACECAECVQLCQRVKRTCANTRLSLKNEVSIILGNTAQNVVSFRSSICIPIMEIAADTHANRFVRTGFYGEHEVKRVTQ